MDITPYISSIVTVLVAVVGAYVAMKNANNQKFQELSVQIAHLSTQVEDLKEQVEKHNSIVERTFKLESDMHTAFKRIDELKERDDKLEAKIER
ncbi:MAG: hypothetical protein IJ087_14445 [Eggerthellaceae bacterium]|nr:hypothetical protein [Eggerthellaceae bacterium]